MITLKLLDNMALILICLMQLSLFNLKLLSDQSYIESAGVKCY